MTIRFRIKAEADGQCLARIIDHFAQEGLIPSSVLANHVGHVLDIVIEHPTMEIAAGQAMCSRMSRLIMVDTASVQHLPPR